MKQYLFDSKDLIKFIYCKLSNPTVIRTNVGLSLIASLYYLTYGKLDNYPNELCKMDFKNYGFAYIDTKAFIQFKDLDNKDKYSINEEIFEKDNNEKQEIKNFMVYIISQLNDIFDWQLIQKVNNGFNKKINNMPIYMSINKVVNGIDENIIKNIDFQ